MRSIVPATIDCYFYRFKTIQNNASTDESRQDESVNRPSTTTSMESTYSINLTDFFTERERVKCSPNKLETKDFLKTGSMDCELNPSGEHE
jgi:hypothetical protein